MISRSRKKGFALVELIATIVLIAVIGAIIIFIVTICTAVIKREEYLDNKYNISKINEE